MDNNASRPVNNKKSIVPIIFGVLVLILIVGSGAYYLGTQNTRIIDVNQINYSQPTANPENNTAINPVDVSTANWKSYSNNVFGLSFKYPSAFTVSDKLPTVKSAVIGASSNLVLEDKLKNMTLSVWVNPDGFGPFFADKVYEEVSYSDSKGIYVVRETTIPKNEDSIPGTTTIMTRQDLQVSGHNLFLVFTYDENDIDGEKVFKDMLSTFSLLNKAGVSF